MTLSIDYIQFFIFEDDVSLSNLLNNFIRIDFIISWSIKHYHFYNKKVFLNKNRIKILL